MWCEALVQPVRSNTNLRACSLHLGITYWRATLGGGVVQCDISHSRCHTLDLAMLQVMVDRMVEETRVCVRPCFSPRPGSMPRS